MKGVQHLVDEGAEKLAVPVKFIHAGKVLLGAGRNSKIDLVVVYLHQLDTTHRLLKHLPSLQVDQLDPQVPAHAQLSPINRSKLIAMLVAGEDGHYLV